MELSSNSLSNEISKGSVNEALSMRRATMEDALSRSASGRRPDAISNEEIHIGDPILDTYKVTSDAIHGGMGSVWRVHHNGWDVDLAMKRPQPKYFAEGSDDSKEEFIAECENWINLGLHPGIVSCYYVRDISGVPSIFSEWMDGGSLRDRIRDGSIYEGTEQEVQERILRIAIQTARGLRYSHEQGLVHQDVKPGNVLLSKEWDAKVSDFGLAKAQSRLRDGGKPLSFGGTLEYCPREQAEGGEPERWRADGHRNVCRRPVMENRRGSRGAGGRDPGKLSGILPGVSGGGACGVAAPPGRRECVREQCIRAQCIRGQCRREYGRRYFIW